MLNELMILLAKYLYLLIVLIGIVFVGIRLKTKKKDIVWITLISLPLILIIAKISGYFFYNPRPFVVHHFIPLVQHIADNGFPSDHALLSFAIASLAFVFNKKLGLVLFVVGVFVGFSRVYVGIHSPIDIIGSFIISTVVTYLVYRFFLLKLPHLISNK
jgi:undecaprenyl-diphosphatase